LKVNSSSGRKGGYPLFGDARCVFGLGQPHDRSADDGLFRRFDRRDAGSPCWRTSVRLFKGLPRTKAADGRFRVVILIGLDDATLVGAPRKMSLGSIRDLHAPDSVIIDKAGYQFFFPHEALQLGKTFEMNDHRVKVVGISDASAPFQTFPVFFTRYSQAIRYVGQERNLLSFVLVKATPGVALAERLPNRQRILFRWMSSSRRRSLQGSRRAATGCSMTSTHRAGYSGE
jgi:hypothetical protein